MSEPTTDPSSEPQDTKDLPDLDGVDAKIHEAHDAEDHLTDVMPSALSDDDGFEGMSSPAEAGVEETDESREGGGAGNS